PDFPPALSGLALIAQQEGKVGAALELFKRALNPEAEGFDPGVIEAFARFVDQHTDQSVTFIEWLDGYLELYPDDLRAHVIAGDYFRRNANADRALQLWGWVYSQRPDYPKLAQRLGQLHAQRGNFVQAAEIFDKLQQAEPSADHFYLAATARANIPDLEGAKQLFEHGAREYPEDPRFPMGIGQVLYEQGDYEAARTRLLPLTEAPEPRFEVFRELGHVEIKRGFLDLADEWLAKAEALRPQDPLTHFQRGYLAARRGDRAAFEAHLQRVLDSGAVTMEDLAQFDNHVELFAIDWAREWLDRRTLVPPGQAR
ncbi:MAG TPA: tetratricopeptide repeat protein, partial [bacterium]|nr:tetratricopeptide repeat protein [bacterium]